MHQRDKKEHYTLLNDEILHIVRMRMITHLNNNIQLLLQVEQADPVNGRGGGAASLAFTRQTNFISYIKILYVIFAFDSLMRVSIVN